MASGLSPGSHSGGSRLNEAVYVALKQRLLDGDYASGDRLSAENLKVEFGASKQPVMEALRRLSGEGMITILPQIGSIVTSYSAQEIRDFFLMFGGLEGTIASVAAERRTDDQIARLREESTVHERLERISDPVERSRAFRIAYRHFHALVHEMAQSAVMAYNSERMWDLADFLIATSRSDQRLTAVADARTHDHDDITEALASGDSAAAEALMSQHVRSVADLIT